MKISIITINYNGSKETLKLLESLKTQTDQDFEVIVVDNASEEADFKNLEKYYTTNQNLWRAALHIYRQEGNLGFSGGNNVGIRQALQGGSDWVVLLNNDTWVENDFVERLKAFLSDRGGVVGLPLNEGEKVAYYGKIEWLKPTLNHEYGIMNNELGTNDHNSKFIIHNSFYAIGGAVAIHKNVFEKIGFLDEKYFLYFEDADFSIRARKAWFNVSITENLKVNHHISSSAKKLGSSTLLRYHYRNALYFNFKNSPWYIKLLVWPWSLIIVIKQLSKLVIRYNIEQSKAILAGVIDFYKNRMGKI